MGLAELFAEQSRHEHRRSRGLTDRLILRQLIPHSQFGKKDEFSEAEWLALRPKIESEFAARTAFRQQQLDYNEQAGLRSFFQRRYAEACPAPAGLPSYGLALGCLLALPVIQQMTTEVAMLWKEAELQYEPTEHDLDFISEKQVEARHMGCDMWKEKFPEIKKQSEEKQIAILAELSSMLLPHYPAHPDPKKTVEKVRKEKREGVEALDIIEALIEDLSGVHAAFACRESL